MSPAAARDYFAVVTTIQAPTPSVRKLQACLSATNGELIVAGDAKGPADFPLDGDSAFLSLRAQVDSRFVLARKLPANHYGRKNVGYLFAIERGARLIYETDDDNAPLAGWKPRPLAAACRDVRARGWVNAYRYFSSEHIWPRGFPLDAIAAPNEPPAAGDAAGVSVVAPIQQGLANNSPDVDAVWRLTQDRPFSFDDGPSVRLPPGAWCPFNSQSTWWWPAAFPLMYLPSHCSFRMTDIWRSFVAQRCLWQLGHGIVFHAPEVVQERNPHDLMRDFSDEVPGYLRNREIARILEELALSDSPSATAGNLRRCYEALVERAVFPATELDLVDAWLADLGSLAMQA